MTLASHTESGAASVEVLRQPKGLYVLFMTETWERFSFYGMQALLVFYLTQHFLLSDAEALAIFGGYVALAHASPLLGGFVADRWLGLRKAVILGGILLTLGHFGMALEGHQAVRSTSPTGAEVIHRDEFALQVMYFSISLIALGTGFLKPNITAALGRLYTEDDPRRDAGFTLFFLGINIGGGTAALLVGWLGQAVGWRYGFGAAGIGMLIGMAIFLIGQRHLGTGVEAPDPALLKQRPGGALSLEALINLGAAATIILAWQLIQHRTAMDIAALILCGAVIAWLSRLILFSCTRDERHRLLRALIFMGFNIIFWVAVYQAASSMNLFIDRQVDRHVLGFEIQASQFLVLSTIFVLLFAPVISRVTTRLSAAGKDPGMTRKFAVGMIVNSLGFFTLAAAASAARHGTVEPWWIVLAYGFNSVGELLVAPTGLAMVTKLSPQRVVGTMTGVWFLMIAGAGLLASALAGAAVPDPGQAGDSGSYGRLFLGLGAALACTGIVLALLRPLMESTGKHKRRSLQA